MTQGLDAIRLSKLLTPFVDQVTCLECCKCYVAPETANCGHTFCHTCWKKRRTCPCCAAPINRNKLKLNLPLQNKTEHAQMLNEAFEKLFHFKLDEFVLDDVQSSELESENDPAKNVKEWLASSQNHFSAPLLSSEHSTQDITSVEHLTSEVQVHMDSKKATTHEKVVIKHQSQDDWEKIELLPDTEEYDGKCMNVETKETKVILDNEYSVENPRRSSRKRELQKDESVLKSHNASMDKGSSKNSSTDVHKLRQKWNNVKRMRQEFSKLNKKNKNKLNVSIEMCRKTQATKNKNENSKGAAESEQYFIDENTPNQPTQKEIAEIISSKVIQEGSVQGVNINGKPNNGSFNLSKEDSLSKNSTSHSHLNEIHSKDAVCSNSNKINEKHLTKVASGKETVKMPFIKKGALCTEPKQSNIKTFNIDCTDNENTANIEISIKVGNTITNIIIKRGKDSQVQVNDYVDKECQISLGPYTLPLENNIPPQKENVMQNIVMNLQSKEITQKHAENTTYKNLKPNGSLNKSKSAKKNTDSADTVTAQFEITESVEKELFKVMECDSEPNDKRYLIKPNNETKESLIIKEKSSKTEQTHVVIDSQADIQRPILVENIEDQHDMDIFDSGSIKSHNVQSLKHSKNTPSEILVPTIRTNKMKTQKQVDKRNRDITDDICMPNKKLKAIHNEVFENNEKNTVVKSLHSVFDHDSEIINYDAIMGQVFANIDADIVNTEKTKDATKVSTVSENVQEQITSSLDLHDDTVNQQKIQNEKYSENVFSLIDKDNEVTDSTEVKDHKRVSTQQNIDNLLTPGVFRQLSCTRDSQLQAEDVEKQLCTPNCDDDDKSIVEETPQKNILFSKVKNKSELSNDQIKLNSLKQNCAAESAVKSVVNLSDTTSNSTKISKEVTVIDVDKRKQTETPLTINKFVDQIKHKSTPVARKSLNFENDNDDVDVDPEQTLCATVEPVAKTTQEKEIMSKAFELTPKSPARRPLTTKNIKIDNKNYCIAGSCLSPMELTRLKVLCRKHNWKFVDKYTSELTHLVVAVDEENKSQRSVKYMCALAASKWIVSYHWVEACLKANKIVGEENYEALDGTGELGPKRSRIAKKKLFEGITFFCMPPFSVLDVGTLKSMLEAAGGNVVNEVRAVRVSEDKPALLLAEPENTQENKFIYMAVELNIVPVNYEWVLNCLGSYTLSSIHELLLCPPSLLPAATEKWPAQLVSQDDD